MFELKGKKALITGASGGIGGEIARTLHKAGADIAISGTRLESLNSLLSIKVPATEKIITLIIRITKADKTM